MQARLAKKVLLNWEGWGDAAVAVSTSHSETVGAFANTKIRALKT